jgi:SnoaL-like domain
MSSVQDERDIGRLLALYCHHCDDRDFGALADLFCPDGRFTFGDVDAAGRLAIVEWFEANNPPHPRGKHLTLNSVFEVSRPTAAVTSDFVFLRECEEAIVPVVAGRYHDVFECMEGKWRIKHRVVAVDMRSTAAKPQRHN